MAPPRKALIAVTSAHALLYPDGKETGNVPPRNEHSANQSEKGLFVTEALHPFNVFRKAGFEVDLVSETGTYQADWLSQQDDWLKGDDRKEWENTSSDFRKKLDAGMKPGDVKPDEVGRCIVPCYTVD